MDKVENRPLWRRVADFPLVALLAAAAIYIFVAGISLAAGKPFETWAQPERAIARGIITVGLVLAAYKLLIARLGEHPRDDLRLSDDAVRNLLIGIAIGCGIMALAVGIAAALGVYRIIGPGDASRLILELASVAILPAFTEELFFRGILFRWIEEFGGSWAALAVTSLLFGFAHIMNPGATWFSSLAIAIEAGVLLGGAYMLTRSLWLPMGLHAGWNFTQGEIFDVNVSGGEEHGLVHAQMSGPPLLSGGQFGLEASIIGLTIATAVGVWMVWLALKKGELIAPLWVRRRPQSELC